MSFGGMASSLSLTRPNPTLMLGKGLTSYGSFSKMMRNQPASRASVGGTLLEPAENADGRSRRLHGANVKQPAFKRNRSFRKERKRVPNRLELICQVKRNVGEPVQRWKVLIQP